MRQAVLLLVCLLIAVRVGAGEHAGGRRVTAASAWTGRRPLAVGSSSPAFAANRRLRAALILRGGEDDPFDVADNFDDDVQEEDFMEDNLVTRVKLAWEKTPFITKNFFRASAILTIYGWLLNGNQWPGWLDLRWKPTLFRFQLWRPFTSFLFFGPFGLNYLLTSHFVWTYMGELERMHFQQPEVFLVMMTFGAACLLAVTTALGLSSAFLGHSLSCYLVYVWSRTYEGADVNVLDMFTLRAELLPWFFVIQTLILEGQTPILDLMGIFAGYMYQFLKLKGRIVPPSFLVRLFEMDFVKQDYQRFAREFGEDPTYYEGGDQDCIGAEEREENYLGDFEMEELDEDASDSDYPS